MLILKKIYFIFLNINNFKKSLSQSQTLSKIKSRAFTFFHATGFVAKVFGSVVAVAFQIAFHAEKNANNIFLFFKNHF